MANRVKSLCRASEVDLFDTGWRGRLARRLAHMSASLSQESLTIHPMHRLFEVTFEHHQPTELVPRLR